MLGFTVSLTQLGSKSSVIGTSDMHISNGETWPEKRAFTMKATEKTSGWCTGICKALQRWWRIRDWDCCYSLPWDFRNKHVISNQHNSLSWADKVDNSDYEFLASSVNCPLSVHHCVASLPLWKHGGCFHQKWF